VVALISDRTGQMKAADDESAGRTTERRSGTTYTSGTLTADRPSEDDSGQTTTMRPISPAPASRATAAVKAPARSRFPERPTAAEPMLSDDSAVLGAVGPRPRASGLATFALLAGLLAAVAVTTGALAGIGAGLGLVAALLAFGGISATGRRHVAGKADALLGLVLGLASLVFGVAALSGRFGWLNAHTNYISDLHQWLQLHASWMLPS
jgi:hypothetical protein